MFILDPLGAVVVNPEYLMIPQFNTIWKADKTKNKEKAMAKFLYIFYMCDYKSPYNSYGDDKEGQVLTDFMGGLDFNPKEKVILEAMAKYDELKKIPEVHFLEASRKVLFQLTNYMNTLVITDDKLATAASKALESVSKNLASYTGIKDTVEKELSKTGKRVGQAKKGLFEDPA